MAVAAQEGLGRARDVAVAEMRPRRDVVVARPGHVRVEESRQ